MSASLVGSEMCIRDRFFRAQGPNPTTPANPRQTPPGWPNQRGRRRHRAARPLRPINDGPRPST
eukprot:3580295-Alexandrium_andersonii.AAC.1